MFHIFYAKTFSKAGKNLLKDIKKYIFHIEIFCTFNFLIYSIGLNNPYMGFRSAATLTSRRVYSSIWSFQRSEIPCSFHVFVNIGNPVNNPTQFKPVIVEIYYRHSFSHSHPVLFNLLRFVSYFSFCFVWLCFGGVYQHIFVLA